MSGGLDLAVTDREVLIGISVEVRHLREDLHQLDEKLDDLPVRVRRLEEREESQRRFWGKLRSGLWALLLVIVGAGARQLFL